MRWKVFAGWIAAVVTTLLAGAPACGADSTVVFVCEHGSSRSLMAASFFNRMAEERGLPIRAVSRAASDKTVDQKVPDKLAQAMSAEGFQVADFKPQALTPAEASSAARVVALAYQDPMESAGDATVERWSDIGSPSREFSKTKEAIVSHVASLLNELGKSGASRTHGEEIRLLSAASMQTVFKEILGDFERRYGHKVVVQYSTMGAITGRVAGGEQADLVISSPASIASLVAQGKISSGSELLIAKTGIGAVVPAGDPGPRIESLEDFKRALLDARVIVYANPAGGGAAGVHIGRLIEKLGLAEQLKSKTTFGVGGDVAEVTVAQGPGALGLTQVSEIAGKPGMQLVALPDELQNYTGFVAGIPSGVKPSPAVGQFVAFLKTPAAIAVMKDKGMKVD